MDHFRQHGGVTATTSKHSHDWSVTYSRSSGPGGQNVNKVNTKATLKLDLDRAAKWLPKHTLINLRDTVSYCAGGRRAEGIARAKSGAAESPQATGSVSTADIRHTHTHRLFTASTPAILCTHIQLSHPTLHEASHSGSKLARLSAEVSVLPCSTARGHVTSTWRLAPGRPCTDVSPSLPLHSTPFPHTGSKRSSLMPQSKVRMQSCSGGRCLPVRIVRLSVCAWVLECHPSLELRCQQASKAKRQRRRRSTSKD